MGVNVMGLVGVSFLVAVYFTFYEQIDGIMKGGNKCPVDHGKKKKIKQELLGQGEEKGGEGGKKLHHGSDANLKTV